LFIYLLRRFIYEIFTLTKFKDCSDFVPTHVLRYYFEICLFEVLLHLINRLFYIKTQRPNEDFRGNCPDFDKTKRVFHFFALPRCDQLFILPFTPNWTTCAAKANSWSWKSFQQTVPT